MFKEWITLSTGQAIIQQIQHVGKSFNGPIIHEKSKSVSIMKCVALQKCGQMCKSKENCSTG